MKYEDAVELESGDKVLIVRCALHDPERRTGCRWCSRIGSVTTIAEANACGDICTEDGTRFFFGEVVKVSNHE